ncbi:hypothetical protein FGO68_gene9056 [Halteria grandinella]|uniref:RING-type domain-containing protein n=1 Tax=Halteria grandinella TaxID=5974 RepID=A0A8J8NW77_HALGN|nr:hypothetical protein FGO68_gene9056 [Halteria grandinella]
MVEYNKFGASAAARRVSDVTTEDLDLTDKEHCILCFNDMKYFALGKCNHKNVCHTCILRLRFIMKDMKCPICKTVSEEVLIAESESLNYEQFQKGEFKKKLLTDNEDAKIYYENAKVKAAGEYLRQLQCLVYKCNPSHQFSSQEALKSHLERDHQKTFCKICLKGRLVFIKEQRLYNINFLRAHIDHGDPGNEKQAEILPHPWCDFCEEYFFNDQQFYDHLSRQHLTCHLCPPNQYKNVYYSSYPSLENHFSKSHHLCPYENCKLKCYVAFRTSDELGAHVDIEHKASVRV